MCFIPVFERSRYCKGGQKIYTAATTTTLLACIQPVVYACNRGRLSVRHRGGQRIALQSSPLTLTPLFLRPETASPGVSRLLFLSAPLFPAPPPLLNPNAKPQRANCLLTSPSTQAADICASACIYVRVCVYIHVYKYTAAVNKVCVSETRRGLSAPSLFRLLSVPASLSYSLSRAQCFRGMAAVGHPGGIIIPTSIFGDPSPHAHAHINVYNVKTQASVQRNVLYA